MKDELNQTTQSWRPASAYILAAVCLLLGTLVGYLLRGSAATASASIQVRGGKATASAAAEAQMPSLEDLKQMADKQAEPVLAKLQASPNNPDLLTQLGAIYEATHRFKEAAEYYQKALAITPENVGVRTHAASCLYYAGDVDAAIAQLQQSLKDDPHNANALFNLGLIKWQGKKDARGALGAWQILLDTNPKLEASKKAEVQSLMTEVGQRTKSGLATHISGK
jgi:tetratricopeptide (TPR) repeat protein